MEPLTLAVLAAGVGVSKLLDSNKDKIIESIERHMSDKALSQERLVANLKLSESRHDLADLGALGNKR